MIASCTAPELLPQVDLAGAKPVANGPLAENHPASTPFSAWTAATPLTLVAPGDTNMAVLDNLGVRVEVDQVRVGRILVRCSGCTGESKNAEGWMPRGVLWVQTPASETESENAKDPLTLALRLRAQWTIQKNLPPNTNADTLCAIVDQGFKVDASQAIATLGGGKVVLKRIGANWTLDAIVAPTEVVSGSCG